MLLRGACGALGLAAFFFAVSVMDLGDATTVFFTGPIFTAIFAHIFLGEHISVAAATASVMSLAGVTLVSRPAFIFGSKTLEPPTPLELAGVASALAGAVLSAAAYVIVRKFSTTARHGNKGPAATCPSSLSVDLPSPPPSLTSPPQLLPRPFPANLPA